MFWPFDVSSVPENATIDSVACKARAGMASISNITSATLQLYSGDTPKGSSTSFKSTTATVYTIETGTWTRSELSSIRLRIAVVNLSSSTRNARFYGADLTVTYTYQSEKFMLKLGGAWHDIARVFKKVNGIWVEQTELANVVDQTKRLANGGEYVVELPEGYTRLEYIESTGSQWFDTGFTPNQDSRVVVETEFTVLDDNAWMFGVRKTSNAQGFGAFYDTSTGTLGAAYGNEQISGDLSAKTGTRYHFDLNKNKLTVDDSTIDFNAQTFTAHATLPMFVRYSNTAYAAYSYEKRYVTRVYDNGEMVRNYIPCINPSGVVGMYDVVTDTFKSSASSTPFLAPESAGAAITFTIDGASYRGESGMTWTEWIASAYNTKPANLVINEGYVCWSSTDYYKLADSSGAYVKATDTLKANHAYTIP